MALTTHDGARLYELFEDGESTGLVVGGAFFDAEYFEQEAKAAGHPEEILVLLSDTALRATLLADSDD